MLIRKTISERIFDVINIFLMLLLVAFTLVPFIHVLFASISSSRHIMLSRGLIIWPRDITIQAYRFAFQNPFLISSYRNTILYAICGTALGVFIMSMAAYALTKKDWPLKNLFLLIIVIPMFFGGGLIPHYLNIRNLGLLNTFWVMFIPSCISTFSIIILRTGFNQVPSSIPESAYMDGANDLTVLFRLVIPLSKAVIAVISLFSIVGFWNHWFNGLIFLRNRNLYPLQLILREILVLGENRTLDQALQASMQDITDQGGDLVAMREGIKYATIVISIGPIVLAYPFLQKYFVKGVMIGAIKG